jgi:hypothetical protein
MAKFFIDKLRKLRIEMIASITDNVSNSGGRMLIPHGKNCTYFYQKDSESQPEEREIVCVYIVDGKAVYLDDAGHEATDAEILTDDLYYIADLLISEREHESKTV